MGGKNEGCVEARNFGNFMSWLNFQHISRYQNLLCINTQKHDEKAQINRFFCLVLNLVTLFSGGKVEIFETFKKFT